MNKFKAWLIRKLGGYVYLADTEKILYKTLPCSKFHVDITLPPMELNFTEEDIADFIYREAAAKIGWFIINNHLYDLQQNYNIEFDRETVRFTIRAIPSTEPDLGFELHHTTKDGE